MTKKLIIGCLIFGAAAFAAYYLTVLATPYAVLAFVKTGAKSKLNQPVYSDIITDKDRHVVLPNPDFLYVACGYNLWEGPLRITGKMPDNSYASVALYASNTKNYYILNDRQVPQKEFDVLLVKEKDRSKFQTSENEVVASPTNLGVILMRILINDTSNIDYLSNIRDSFKVQLVEQQKN